MAQHDIIMQQQVVAAVSDALKTPAGEGVLNVIGFFIPFVLLGRIKQALCVYFTYTTILINLVDNRSALFCQVLFCKIISDFFIDGHELTNYYVQYKGLDASGIS